MNFDDLINGLLGLGVLVLLIGGPVFIRWRAGTETLIEGKSAEQYWKDFYAEKNKEED